LQASQSHRTSSSATVVGNCDSIKNDSGRSSARILRYVIGIPVEVTPETLYEAVAQGLAAIRGNEWIAGIAQGLNVVKVSVADVRVGHESICVREWQVRRTNHARLKLGIVEPVFAKVLHRCPKCGSESVKRSRRRGFVERVVLWFLRVWPYRCEKCDTRNWDFTSSKNKNQSTEEPKH
jgi:hypothetical protein